MSRNVRARTSSNAASQSAHRHSRTARAGRAAAILQQHEETNLGVGSCLVGASQPAYAAAAAASPSPPAAAAAASSSSGRRSSSGAAAAAVSSSSGAAAAAASARADSDNDSDVVEAVGGDDDDDSWRLPELRGSLLDLNLFKFTLTPASAPVFMKYKQAELDQLVGEVMKFLLARASAGLVTAHKDILTLIGDRAKGGANSILADARRRFMTIYGWELREIDKTTEAAAAAAPAAAAAGKKRKSAGAPAAAAAASESGAAGGGGGAHGTKSYILSVHPSCARTMGMARAFNFGVGEWAEGDDDEDGSGEDHPGAPSQSELQKGLLFFILALCYTEERNPSNQNGGGGAGAAGGGGGGGFVGVSSTKLWKSLHKCDPHMKEKQKAHPVFGNVAEVIDDLVKQHYLDRVKVSVPDPNDADAPPRDEIAYRIGARGRAEISTKSVYEGMCKSMMGQAPDDTHLKQIERNEQLKQAATSRKAAGAVRSKPAAAAAASQP